MAGGWLRGLGLPIAMLLLWSAAPVSAAWFEARSRHFIVYSEGSPASVRKFASDLERFDQAVRKLLGYKDDAAGGANPVTVFAVDNVSAINKLLCKNNPSADPRTCKYIAGFYRPRVSGSVAFVPRRTGGNQDTQTILFHEYAHHLMLAHSGAAYPAWYVEGFAEFVSYAKVNKETHVEIGLPAQSRAGALFQLGSMPVRELLGSHPGKLSPTKGAVFYARSWLLTHYLCFETARRDQIVKYLDAFNKGVPSLEAANSAFGDLDVLDRDVASYLQRGRFPGFAVPVPAIPDDAVRLRQLDPGEAAMMAIRIQSSRGVNGETAPEVASDARQIAAAYPDDARAQVILAEAEFDDEKFDAAEAAVDRALARAPDDPDAAIYKARLLMQRAQGLPSHDEAAWKAARKWLLKANSVETDAAWPLYLYYQSFRRQGARPTTNAVDALLRAFELVPQDGDVRMAVVSHYLSEDKFAEARTVLAPLAFNPHLSPGHPAVKLLEHIDARDKAGIRALAVSGSEEAE